MSGAAELRLRRVSPPHGYRVVWHGLEIGSIGLQQGAGQRTFWSWGIDTDEPVRDLATHGEAADREGAAAAFKAAWARYAADRARLARSIVSKLALIERSRAWRGGPLPGPGAEDLEQLAHLVRCHAPGEFVRMADLFTSADDRAGNAVG